MGCGPLSAPRHRTTISPSASPVAASASGSCGEPGVDPLLDPRHVPRQPRRRRVARVYRVLRGVGDAHPGERRHVDAAVSPPQRLAGERRVAHRDALARARRRVQRQGHGPAPHGDSEGRLGSAVQPHREGVARRNRVLVQRPVERQLQLIAVDGRRAWAAQWTVALRKDVSGYRPCAKSCGVSSGKPNVVLDAGVQSAQCEEWPGAGGKGLSCAASGFIDCTVPRVRRGTAAVRRPVQGDLTSIRTRYGKARGAQRSSIDTIGSGLEHNQPRRPPRPVGHRDRKITAPQVVVPRRGRLGVRVLGRVGDRERPDRGRRPRNLPRRGVEDQPRRQPRHPVLVLAVLRKRVGGDDPRLGGDEPVAARRRGQRLLVRHRLVQRDRQVRLRVERRRRRVAVRRPGEARHDERDVRADTRAARVRRREVQPQLARLPRRAGLEPDPSLALAVRPAPLGRAVLRLIQRVDVDLDVRVRREGPREAQGLRVVVVEQGRHAGTSRGAHQRNDVLRRVERHVDRAHRAAADVDVAVLVQQLRRAVRPHRDRESLDRRVVRGVARAVLIIVRVVGAVGDRPHPGRRRRPRNRPRRLVEDEPRRQPGHGVGVLAVEREVIMGFPRYRVAARRRGQLEALLHVRRQHQVVRLRQQRWRPVRVGEALHVERDVRADRAALPVRRRDVQPHLARAPRRRALEVDESLDYFAREVRLRSDQNKRNDVDIGVRVGVPIEGQGVAVHVVEHRRFGRSCYRAFEIVSDQRSVFDELAGVRRLRAHGPGPGEFRADVVYQAPQRRRMVHRERECLARRVAHGVARAVLITVRVVGAVGDRERPGLRRRPRNLPRILVEDQARRQPGHGVGVGTVERGLRNTRIRIPRGDHVAARRRAEREVVHRLVQPEPPVVRRRERWLVLRPVVLRRPGEALHLEGDVRADRGVVRVRRRHVHPHHALDPRRRALEPDFSRAVAAREGRRRRLGQIERNDVDIRVRAGGPREGQFIVVRVVEHRRIGITCRAFTESDQRTEAGEGVGRRVRIRARRSGAGVFRADIAYQLPQRRRVVRVVPVVRRGGRGDGECHQDKQRRQAEQGPTAKELGGTTWEPHAVTSRG